MLFARVTEEARVVEEASVAKEDRVTEEARAGKEACDTILREVEAYREAARVRAVEERDRAHVAEAEEARAAGERDRACVAEEARVAATGEPIARPKLVAPLWRGHARPGARLTRFAPPGKMRASDEKSTQGKPRPRSRHWHTNARWRRRPRAALSAPQSPPCGPKCACWPAASAATGREIA